MADTGVKQVTKADIAHALKEAEDQLEESRKKVTALNALLEGPASQVMKGRRVLVCIDGSEFAEKATVWAMENLLQKDDVVVFLYAQEQVTDTSAMLLEPNVGIQVANFTSALRTKVVQKSHAVLQKFHQLITSKSPAFEWTIEVQEGDPRVVICDFAKTHHIEMVVMGSRSLGVIKRAVLGSVSKYCTDHLHCPIVIWKQEK